MKTSIFSLALLSLGLGVGPVGAQLPASGNALQSLRVAHSDLPVFPVELLSVGIREGEVRVAFSVDSDGRVEDCLAVAYTHPDFARVTLNALKRWRFDPARYQGQAIAAASEIDVKFEVEGTVVVSMTPNESVDARLNSLLGAHGGYRLHSLRELDRIPTPIAAPSPAFPARLAKSGGAGQVNVSFYIDEDGAVRLPSVNADDDPELAAVAINALRNWKFEPPLCKGRPVLVRATQLFNFRATTETKSNG